MSEQRPEAEPRSMTGSAAVRVDGKNGVGVASPNEEFCNG